MNTPSPDAQNARATLEEQLRHVHNKQEAEHVVHELEALSGNASIAEVGDSVQADNPSKEIQTAAKDGDSLESSAKVIAAAAAESTSSAVGQDDPAMKGIEQAFDPVAPADSEVTEGRTLVREAVLERMNRLETIDARLFLTVNGLPHTPMTDKITRGITLWTTGGWIWSAGLVVAWMLRVPKAAEALKFTLPGVAISTLIVEEVIKGLFRRRRPFISIVRALVVGRKPGSWSFPSGHTAASFAAAWLVSNTYKKQAPVFYSLASLVGLSRIYAGAHYPGDVFTGAVFGASLAEVSRRLLKRLFDELD